jgi:hypothetical protein
MIAPSSIQQSGFSTAAGTTNPALRNFRAAGDGCSTMNTGNEFGSMLPDLKMPYGIIANTEGNVGVAMRAQSIACYRESQIHPVFLQEARKTWHRRLPVPAAFQRPDSLKSPFRILRLRWKTNEVGLAILLPQADPVEVLMEDERKPQDRQ